jgi:hypothetical protein
VAKLEAQFPDNLRLPNDLALLDGEIAKLERQSH